MGPVPLRGGCGRGGVPMPGGTLGGLEDGGGVGGGNTAGLSPAH